jgi:hypothetical protein
MKQSMAFAKTAGSVGAEYLSQLSILKGEKLLISPQTYMKN